MPGFGAIPEVKPEFQVSAGGPRMTGSTISRRRVQRRRTCRRQEEEQASSFAGTLRNAMRTEPHWRRGGPRGSKKKASTQTDGVRSTLQAEGERASERHVDRRGVGVDVDTCRHQKQVEGEITMTMRGVCAGEAREGEAKARRTARFGIEGKARGDGGEMSKEKRDGEQGRKTIRRRGGPTATGPST